MLYLDVSIEKIGTINSLRPSDTIWSGNFMINIGPDNGLVPGGLQVIIWTNAGKFCIRHSGTTFSEIFVSKFIQIFLSNKMVLKTTSAKWQPFVNMLIPKVTHMSRVSCQKGPTHHAYAWQIGPFWQDTLDVGIPVSQAQPALMVIKLPRHPWRVKASISITPMKHQHCNWPLHNMLWNDGLTIGKRFPIQIDVWTSVVEFLATRIDENMLSESQMRSNGAMG